MKPYSAHMMGLVIHSHEPSEIGRSQPVAQPPLMLAPPSAAPTQTPPSPDASIGLLPQAALSLPASVSTTTSHDPAVVVVTDTDPNRLSQPAAAVPGVIPGKVRLGLMRRHRDTHQVLVNPPLRELLEQSVEADTVLEAVDDDTQLSILDLDVHHLQDKPTDASLIASASSLSPCPQAWWITHGSGLKALYAGPHHREHALAAALSAPGDFEIELLAHTRHPGGASSKTGHGVCRAIHLTEADPNQPFTLQQVGPLVPEMRAKALAMLGLNSGQRYDHDHCPLDPLADSQARDCVVVLEHGVFCHRCNGKGIRYHPQLAAGFYPLAAALDVPAAATVLDKLARTPVHWTHAQHVLKHAFPRMQLRLLQEAYRLALEARSHYPEMIARVFDEDLQFVFSTYGWINPQTFEHTNVDSDAANGLPYVLKPICDDEDRVHLQASSTRRSNAKYREINGYIPLRPYRGVDLRQDQGQTVPIRYPSSTQHKVELLTDPLPLPQALDLLGQSFPGISPVYLQAALAAMICADARLGPPPMLCCSGPSGSGKGETLRLATSFLEDEGRKTRLDDLGEEFRRLIGQALTAGHRAIVLDEFGKTPRLAQRFQTLLELSSTLTWRPLYQNHCTRPLHAAFFMPCVTFPDFLSMSPEFQRRIAHVRLDRKVPDWLHTSGGDSADWRDRSRENARIANSILTHVWRLCQQQDFHYRKVTNCLGLVPMDEELAGVQKQLLRELYDLVQQQAPTLLSVKSKSFGKSYLSIDDPRLKPLIHGLVPMDDPQEYRYAHKKLRETLEGVDWSGVLGIPMAICCRVRIHGNLVGIKFEEAHAGLRGQQKVNDQLPRIPPASPPVSTLPESVDSPPVPAITLQGANTQASSLEMVTSEPLTPVGTDSGGPPATQADMDSILSAGGYPT